MREYQETRSIITPIEPNEIRTTIVDCKGQWFHETFGRISNILSHQFGNINLKGIKGFIFFGEVGTGKTLMGKILAKELTVQLLFVDGSLIARELYGQSEQQIVKVFKEARRKPTLILIDDAESVFPDREWIKGESWHVAQNNILFHQLDNLDTSRAAVIMTTNKFELLDKALKDRLYPIEFPLPTQEILLEIARQRCLEMDMPHDKITTEICAQPTKYRSVRAVEKLVIEAYIDHVSNVQRSAQLK
jgi:SpoVK/Ycf46/Vps4 family AAA+-type ATPase